MPPDTATRKPTVTAGHRSAAQEVVRQLARGSRWHGRLAKKVAEDPVYCVALCEAVASEIAAAELRGWRAGLSYARQVVRHTAEEQLTDVWPPGWAVGETDAP